MKEIKIDGIKFPKNPVIGGVTYDVWFDTLIGDCEDNMGFFEEKESTIYISSELTEEKKVKTYIHELLHGICFEHGIFLKENEVVNLSVGILDFVKQFHECNKSEQMEVLG